MDAGDYETNTLLVTNLSSVAYRIYEPVAAPSSPYTFAASDVEEALRNDGQIVYMDAVRRGIWCFYLAGKEASASSRPEQLGLCATMEVCGYHLQLVEEGRFELSQLLSRPPVVNPINTPTSSSSTGSVLDLPAKTALTSGPMDLDTKAVANPLPDAKGYASVPVREIHEFFITASLSSISTSFCHHTGAIPLNYRTVLLNSKVLRPDHISSDPSPSMSALATFRVYLATTGTFVISICLSLTKGLVSSVEDLRLQPLPEGSSLLTAPMGAFATFANLLIDGGDNGVVQSPDTQISRFRAEPSEKFTHWKSTCSRLLQMRGMSPSILDGCSWLNIHFLTRKPHDPRTDGKKTPMVGPGPMAPWPAVLCFGKARGLARKQGFILEAKNYDAMGFTRDWLIGAHDREQLLAKRRAEREAAAAIEHGEGDSANFMGSGYSPLQMRGITSQGAAAAAGTMYPTPPDGVQPGVTPSFDGNVASPGNQLPVTSVVDADGSTNMLAPVPEAIGEGWEGTDVKREPPGATFLEGDHLFGDLGEDVFENNRITDADFNFFDEEPEGPSLDIDSPQDVDMSTGLPEVAQKPPSTVTFESAVKQENPRQSPQFTKPELKHARSSLLDSRQQANTDNFIRNTAVGIKRTSSPFNPDTVYKRIRASIHGLPATAGNEQDNDALPRRGNVYERVEFDPALSMVDQKYHGQGQFNPTIPSEKQTSPYQNGGPLVARYKKAPKDSSSGIGSLIAKITGTLEHSSLHHPLPRRDDLPSDGDDVSLVSDQDDTSDSSDEPSSPAFSSMWKRRPDDDVASMAASFKDPESASLDPAYGSIDLSRLSLPHNPEISLSRYFADPEPVSYQLNQTDDDYILVAQILTDQAVGGDLRLGSPREWEEPEETQRALMSAIRHSMQGLRSALPRALGEAAMCQLRPLIEVQDVPIVGQPTRVGPRPVGQELIRPNLYPIHAPHLEVQRFESKVSLLPPAVQFWDSLGLGPAEGAKDVVSICVYPNWEGFQSSVGDFVDGIRSSYETMKLGSLDRMPTSNGIDEGLIPYDIVADSMALEFSGSRIGMSILDQMTRLSHCLAASDSDEKNFVVFFIYDPENPGLIVDACSVFQDLFQKYKRALSDRKKAITNELVLQLVPADRVASETSVVVLSPHDTFKLCIEIYDRCTLFGGEMPAPAIRLEEALPRMVDFKQTTNPSAKLMKEKSHIHIAYAQSVDERWITATWTDNRGTKQMTASYCLGRRGKSLATPFAEVAHEIWETTHDLISVWKVQWRLVITKCGPMDQSEAEFWVQLAQTESKATVSLTLVAVDTKPSLQLLPPVVKIPLTAPATFYSTPVSTPQAASILSPEQNGNPSTPVGATPATPGGDNIVPETDGDTTLVDIADATWGVVVSHRLNNSTSLTDLNPALMSGYLIKRGGPRTEDPPAVLEINVVHTEENPRMFERVLRETMSHFRGLGTLARTRGIVDPVNDVRPWHVAAAEKGVRALYQLM